jgi:hypothetical protein
LAGSFAVTLLDPAVRTDGSTDDEPVGFDDEVASLHPNVKHAHTRASEAGQ